MPTGLPFVSLNGYDGQFAPGTMARSLPQEEIEPGLYRRTDGTRETYSVDWSRFDGGGAPQATPVQTSPVAGDPMEFLRGQSKLALDTALGNIAAQRTALEKSIENDLALNTEQGRLEVEAILNQSDSGLSGDEFRAFQEKKEQQLKAKELERRKKEAAIRAKIHPGLLELDQAAQEAQSGVAMKMALAQRDMAQAQWQAEQGIISPEDAAYLKAVASGQRVTRDMFRQKVDNSLYTQWRQKRAVYADWQAMLNNYQRDKTPPKLSLAAKVGNAAWFGQPFSSPPSSAWKEFNRDTGKYDIDVPRDQADMLTEMEARMADARPQLREMEQKLFGKQPRPTLADTALSPLGQSIPRPATASGLPGGAMPRVQSDADYNQLPSGAEFIDPKGQRRRKP